MNTNRSLSIGRRAVLGLAATAPLALVACGSSGSTTTTDGPPTTAEVAGQTITLLAYDAFTEPDALQDFTAQTGITVTIAKGGDTGTLVNKAILTKGNPEGDVMWGVDNTLLSAATDGTIFDGEPVAVDFRARLRGMERFDSVEALVERMAADVEESRRILGA